MAKGAQCLRRIDLYKYILYSIIVNDFVETGCFSSLVQEYTEQCKTRLTEKILAISFSETRLALCLKTNNIVDELVVKVEGQKKINVVLL